MELTPDQVKRAISILESERSALAISSNQERRLLWLRITNAILFLSYLMMLATIFSAGNDNFPSDSEQFGWLMITYTVLSSVFLLSFFSVSILLILNSKLILNLIRQNRSIRRVGLGGFQKSLWHRYKPSRKLLDYFTTGGAILGGLFVLTALLVFVVFLSGALDITSGLISGTFLLVFGVVLIAPSYTYKLKQRVELLSDVERLRRIFQQMSATDATSENPSVHVSQRDAEQLSVIEATRTNRERAQAIEDRDTVQNAYTLLVSRQVFDKRSNLDLEARLKLEASFQALLEQPHPEESKQLPESSLLKVLVQDTSIVLVYEVDEAHRQVKAIALETEGATSSLSAKGKDPRNA